MPGFQTDNLRGLGGLNEDEDISSLRKGDLSLATNTARLGEMTGTRPGVEYDASGEYDAAVATGGSVQGFVEWSIDQDATRKFVSVIEGKIHVSDTVQLDDTANSLVISDGENDRWTFANHNDVLYAAGGAAGDSVWYWDGTAADPDKIDPVDSLAAVLEPKYIFGWKNHLFLTGMNGAVPDNNPMVWRYSALATDPTNPDNWPAGNTIGGGGIGGLPSYGSDFATGTASFQDNNGEYLLCLTNNRIYSYVLQPNYYNSFQLNDTIANGCVSQHAFVDLGLDSGDAVYVSQVGIHSLRLSQQYSGRSKAFLSWPIRKTWASLNRARIQNIVAGYWPTEGIVAFAVSTGSNTDHNMILAMDIQGIEEVTPDTVRWYKWFLDSDITINTLGMARDSVGQPRLYGGGQAGEIFQFTRNVYSDLGNPYSVAFQTKHDDYGAPGISKTLGDAHLILSGAGEYRPLHEYVLDYGSKTGQATALGLPSAASLWDTMKWDIDKWSDPGQITRMKVFGMGEAQTVAHKFTHGGTDEYFFVAQISQEVAATGEAGVENDGV